MATMLDKGAADDVPAGRSSPFLSFINSATCYANSSDLIGSYDDAATFQKQVLDDLENSASTFIPSKDPGVIEGYKALYRANAEKILLSRVGQVEVVVFCHRKCRPQQRKPDDFYPARPSTPIQSRKVVHHH
jgi:choline dehydrogenase